MWSFQDVGACCESSLGERRREIPCLRGATTMKSLGHGARVAKQPTGKRTSDC
jgi:hypothetical protein